MKKVINITLSSIVFAVEEDAHAMLAEYLEAITARLDEGDDKDEIVADIESALAEKFVAAGKSEKAAITLRDIEHAQSEMGEPAAFGEGSTTDADTHAAASAETKKRLFRDTEDAVLAGVSSGLAQYFDIDPVIVRIGFVVGAFLNGIGIIAYIILWVVVPKAETTAQKFAMRGKRVTIEDITNKVKKNLNSTPLTDPAKVNSVWRTVRELLNSVFGILGVGVRLLLKVARALLGVLFVVGGAVLTAALVSMYSIILLSEKTFLPTEAQEAIAIMLSTPLGIVAIVASCVTMLIPCLVLIIGGASLLKRHNLFTFGKTITLAVVWMIAAVLAGTTSALQAEKVWQEVGVPMETLEYLGEDFEVTITEDGIEVSSSEMFLPPLPDVSPEITSALAGITLSPTMTNLDVSGRGLTDSLPAEIRLLSRLEILDISDNNFTSVPAEVGQLQNLRVLNLSNNNLTGLPYEIGQLQNLELFDVRGNDISEFDLEIIKDRLPASTNVLVD